MSLCGVFLISLMAGSGAEKISEESKEGLDLSGTWKGTLVEKDGAIYGAILENNYLETFDRDDHGLVAHFICVDKGRGKCEITTLFEGGLTAYKQSGDRVKICVSFDGKYPTSFRGGNGQWLLILRRIKTHKEQKSPDGRLLISETATDFKRTLHLWEVLTASELVALPVCSYLRGTTAFSSNGRLLATLAQEGPILVWDLRRGKELHRFKAFNSPVNWLAFSPNSRRLFSGLYNSTLQVWDVPTPVSSPAGKIGAEDAAKAWADLAGSDAPRAFRARWTLVSAPEETTRLLAKHLHPAPAVDRQRLRRLLADLESEQFTVRGKTQEEWENLGDQAEPALRQTLANKPTLEVRLRVEALLDRMSGPVTRPELLQALRAVAVLEDIGTLPARRLLEELAQGAPEARPTREAKESLRRLDSHNSSGR